MAIINYEEILLNRGERIIKWSGVGPSDEGQKYDLTGFKMLSLYARKSEAGNLGVSFKVANEDVDLTDFWSLQDFSLDGGTGMVGLDTQKFKYMGLKGFSGNTGRFTISVLVKEI